MCAARRHSGLGPRGAARTFYSSGRPAAGTTSSRRTTGGAPRNAARVFVDAPTRTVVVSRVRFRSVHGVAAPGWWWHASLVAIVVAGQRRWVDAERDARGTPRGGRVARLSTRRARASRGRSPRRAEGRTHPGRRVRRVSARLARRTTRLSRRGGVRRRRRIIRRVRIHRLLLRVHRRVRDGRHPLSTFARGGSTARASERVWRSASSRACHAGDRERRAAAMETLASRAFSATRSATRRRARRRRVWVSSREVSESPSRPTGPARGARRCSRRGVAFDRLRADAAAAERASQRPSPSGRRLTRRSRRWARTRRVRREGGHPRGDAVAALLAEFVRDLGR